MSALDQAFIKAFAKEPSTASRATSRKGRAAAPLAPHQSGESAEPAVFDEMYDAGTFYRVDTAAERAVPAAHLHEPKVPRRLQRRGANRSETTFGEPVVPANPVAPPPALEPHPQALPPRRNWSRSMLEIARQLANLEQLRQTPDSELPPEIIFTEPPEPELPAPPPAAPAEQNVAVAEPQLAAEIAAEIELPPSAPQAIAALWPVGDFIAQSSVVSLADAETWLALPIAPAVTCDENLANGWSADLTRREVAEPIAEQVAAAPAIERAIEHVIEPAIEQQPVPEKAKKKFRIDVAHQRVPVPHAKIEVRTQEIELPGEAADVDQPTEMEVVATAVAEDVAIVEEVAAAPAARPEPAPAPVAAEAPASTIPKRPYVPLWEVDQFTWPALCDKLMHDPSGYFATASNKLLSVVRGGLKVLGITGSRRGEGRTTLALCLARAAAQAGIQVALLDADFARPQLATMLGLETAYGWQEAAIGKIPLSEAAVKSIGDRLTVLPLEVSTTSAADLSLADPRVTATLRATAATFDLVIVDLGPLSQSDEPLFPPGENCPLDGAIVVRDMRYSLLNESRTIGDRLYDAGIEAVGIAENFVTQPELALL